KADLAHSELAPGLSCRRRGRPVPVEYLDELQPSRADRRRRWVCEHHDPRAARPISGERLGARHDAGVVEEHVREPNLLIEGEAAILFSDAQTAVVAAR